MASLLGNFNTSGDLELNTNSSCDACNHSNTAMPTMYYPLHDPVINAIFITSCIIIALLCVCGNALVLFVVSRSHPVYPRSTYMFLSNLAAADLLIGVFCVIPFMYSFLYFTWELPAFMCRLWKFVETGSLTVSMLLLQAIALERFIAITFPLQARRLFTRCKMCFAQMLVWTIAALYSLPMLFFHNASVYHFGNESSTYCLTEPEFVHLHKVYILMNFGMWYVLPLVMMTVLYLKIGMTLRNSQVNHRGVDLRHRCPDNIRETDEERISGSSTASAARQDGTGTGTNADTQPPDMRRAREGNSPAGFLPQVKLWWRKRKLDRSKPAARIVRRGTCGAQATRGSLKKSPPSKEERHSDGEQLTAQETSFTTHSSSASSRIPLTFSFKASQGGT
ncbi:hypothetical protein EGW08_007524, partial [Elysia chlorotica]